MSSSNIPYQTTTHGKWILAGEHAVIRGHGALVFPLPDKTLTLSYTPADTATELLISTHMLGHEPDTTQTLLQQILEYGLQRVDRSLMDVKGALHIESNIPVGVGMGASAALCVAITRWFAAQQWIDAKNEFTIARELEHFFHGQSSGLDIVGVGGQIGMYFQNSQATSLNLTWSPKWQLSFCGQQGPTANCIQSVQKIWAQSLDIGQLIDQKMQAAVLTAKQALEDPYTADSQPRLAQAIEQAHACFEEWGLITPVLQQHIQDLRNQGALAVKPTGSGGGGFVMSLWDNTL